MEEGEKCHLPDKKRLKVFWGRDEKLQEECAGKQIEEM